MRTGFIGCGRMGGPLADRLLCNGHTVAVYDPVPVAVGPREALGARVASSPADAAVDAEVVCVVVRDDEQAEETIAGSQGVVAGASAGAILLHSTVAPATVRGLARTCQQGGLRFADIEFLGGPSGNGRHALSDVWR